MNKTRRNQLCPCNSNKKYKKCCEPKNREILLDLPINVRVSEPIKSERMIRLNQYLLQRYQILLINVTNMLSSFTMERINKVNCERDVVVAAERLECNEDVFLSKGKDNSDMMVLYKNNFIFFNYDKEWYDMIKQLYGMIPSKPKFYQFA